MIPFYKNTITGDWVLGDIIVAIPGTYELIYQQATDIVTIRSNQHGAIVARAISTEFTDESGMSYANFTALEEATRTFFA
jgi:hypothetical protein